MIVPVAELKFAARVAAVGAAGAAAEDGAATPKSMAPDRAMVVAEAKIRVRISGVPFSAGVRRMNPRSRPPCQKPRRNFVIAGLVPSWA